MQTQRKKQEYTYHDYINWPEEEHWELIEGRAYPTYGPTALAAPNLRHQGFVTEISRSIGNYLVGKQCAVYVSPIDVVFEETENTKTVVQPDVVVICDPKKMENGNRVIGAPDIAVEVLSPSTTPKDWNIKMRLYERQGVKEYWIVSPNDRTIYQNVLKEGQYETITRSDGQLTTEILEGFSLDIEALFVVER